MNWLAAEYAEIPSRLTVEAEAMGPLFEAFSEEDHRAICYALNDRQQHLRGMTRLTEYRTAFPDIVAKAQRAEDRWWISRSAFVRKYGHLP